MAEIAYSNVESLHQGEVLRVTWVGLGPGDWGTPIACSDYPDCSVQLTGTVNGATVNIEGSLDEANYAVLTDPQGNNLALSIAKIEAISELAALKRPNVSGGAGTNVTVTMLLRKTRR